MDRCPAEILLRIFTLACTDGGRTGCALSLVSHAMRTASEPVRFHTVALHSVPHMRHFERLLGDEYELHPPTVRHLFLFDGGYEARYHWGEDLLDVVISIMSAVAPSLVSLAGDVRGIGATYTSVLPPGVHFARLRDLSLSVVSSTYPFFPRSVDLPSLPNLHRLHMSESRCLPTKTEDLISAFTAVAPKLSKIRLSELLSGSDLPRMLDVALKRNCGDFGHKTAQNWTDDEGLEVKLPQHLDKLFMQPVGIAEGIWGIVGILRYNAMITRLSKFAAEHKKVVVLLPACNYWYSDCLRDWLEVIADGEYGDGCWRVPPQQTTSTVLSEQEEDE